MENNNVSLVEDSVHPKSTTAVQQTQPTQSQTSPLTQRQQQASATSPSPPPHVGSELVHTTPVVASTVNLPPLGVSVLPGLGPNSNNNNSNAIVSKGAGQPRTNHHHNQHAIGIQPSPSPSPPPTNNITTQTHNPSHLQQQHNGQPPQFLQQPITFIFERFCSNVPPGPLSLNTPLPSPQIPQMVVRSVMDSTMDVLDAKSLESNVTPSSSPQNLANANTTTTTTTTFHHHPYPYQSPQTHPHTCNNSDTTNTTTNTTSNHNGVVLKKNNKKKRKQQHQQLQTQQLPQYSYRTPIDSPNSMQTQDDSRSEESYADNMLTESVGRCEDYDPSPVESLKRLLMLFPAMSSARLGAILPVLLDNDIDDPEILLLIDNENFLRDLRGKNGSEISRGNCLLLWHGIQEHQRLNASSVHTPKSCSSSPAYSPPPLMMLPHVPRAKRPKLELHGEKDDSASSIISTSSQDSDHHGHVHDHLHHKRPVNHHHHLQGHHHQSNGGNAMTGITRSTPTISTTNNSTKQRVKAPKLSMSTIEEVHSRVDRVLSVVALENERRKHSHLARNPQTQPSLKFEDFVAELKHAHKIPVAFGTLRDMRFAYILKKLNEQKYKELLASNKGNVTEFYRTCQEVCEESFVEDELEGALPWLELKSKLYYK